MPYRVVKKGKQWCVEKRDGSKNFGCHPSKKKAKAQVRALHANVKE